MSHVLMEGTTEAGGYKWSTEEFGLVSMQR